MSGRWGICVAAARRCTQAVSVALLLSLAHPVLAAESEPVSLDCTPPSYSGQQFRKTFEQARETAAALCDAIRQELGGDVADAGLVESHLQQLREVAGAELAGKNINAPAAYNAQFGGLQTRFTGVRIRNLTLPEFVVLPAFGAEASTARFNAIPDGVTPLQITESAACAAAAPGSTCLAIYEEFGQAFNVYREPFEELFDNTRALDELSGQWARFLEVSRSQTALEVVATTFLNRKHFRKNHLVGPPSMQVIVLHPDLAYSYVPSNPDGKNDTAGLSVEWLGVNFWDWPVPLGLSVATLYFDKAGIKDAGIGVQLHLYNRFSAGWSRNGRKNVFYANLDLLKLFEEKGQKYQKYVDAYF